MGILSKIQRDLILGDVENNDYKHLALYTIDIIEQNQQQWGLYILEILTIARKLIRKYFSTVNQFQIYLTGIQFDKENNTETIRLQTQQLFQILRLASTNNKLIKPQQTSTKLHKYLQKSYTTDPEQSPLPPDHIRKAEDIYSKLDSNKSYVVDRDSIHTRGNKQIITKNIIVIDNEEDQSFVEEKQRYDDNQNDSSYIEDSSQYTYYIESDIQEERKSMNHSMTHPVQQTNDVKYVTEENQYQIGNQTRILNQGLEQNMNLNNKEITYQYNQYQIQTDMQSITKEQLQHRFDTRELCISNRITTINSGLYKITKRFLEAITAICKNIDNDAMISMVNMNKGQLAEHIKSMRTQQWKPHLNQKASQDFLTYTFSKMSQQMKAAVFQSVQTIFSPKQDRDLRKMPSKTCLLPQK
ncbi:hypothetical protein OXYTRIMIC_464 [Oxytricha trifallax]|uniref:Uncharacterized protein n=1 Tax=Oxytricha trifallax TaxID=1172189 RepID=A0A073I089_9SPIT|nr:hypothetical protein OXYTRIMIC_464 [Oxytricha trifallax]